MHVPAVRSNIRTPSIIVGGRAWRWQSSHAHIPMVCATPGIHASEHRVQMATQSSFWVALNLSAGDRSAKAAKARGERCGGGRRDAECPQDRVVDGNANAAPPTPRRHDIRNSEFPLSRWNALIQRFPVAESSLKGNRFDLVSGANSFVRDRDAVAHEEPCTPIPNSALNSGFPFWPLGTALIALGAVPSATEASKRARNRGSSCR